MKNGFLNRRIQEARITSYYINGELIGEIVNLHLFTDNKAWYDLTVDEGKILIVEASETPISSFNISEEYSWPVVKFDLFDFWSFGAIRRIQIYALNASYDSELYECGVLLRFENGQVISIVENNGSGMKILDGIDKSLLTQARIQEAV